jgi:hypothetical protein
MKLVSEQAVNAVIEMKSLSQLEALTGLNYSTFSRYRNGRNATKNLSIENLALLTSAYVELTGQKKFSDARAIDENEIEFFFNELPNVRLTNQYCELLDIEPLSLNDMTNARKITRDSKITLDAYDLIIKVNGRIRQMKTIYSDEFQDAIENNLVRLLNQTSKPVMHVSLGIGKPINYFSQMLSRHRRRTHLITNFDEVTYQNIEKAIYNDETLVNKVKEELLKGLI